MAKKKKATRKKQAPKTQERLVAGEAENLEVNTLPSSNDSFNEEQTELEDTIEDQASTEEEETEEEEIEEVEDLEEYFVFTIEGEYIFGEGTQQITGIYSEDFCFKEKREGVARSKIKNFLLDARLRSTIKNYRRFRTHELISVRAAEMKDVKDSTLKSEDIMQMNLNQLAVFSLQENLDITMSQYGSVEEARIRVRSAFKEGKKSRRVYDATPKPLAGEVDKNNNRL